jgi:hypothetical protein
MTVAVYGGKPGDSFSILRYAAFSNFSETVNIFLSNVPAYITCLFSHKKFSNDNYSLLLINVIGQG